MSVLVYIDSFRYIWILVSFGNFWIQYFYNEIEYVAHPFDKPVIYERPVIKIDPIAIPSNKVHVVSMITIGCMYMRVHMYWFYFVHRDIRKPEAIQKGGK